ncbi:MAG: xylulokinase [Eubacteriales bacterium]|nr:xylulokinase [Eubacteriales bacterium]
MAYFMGIDAGTSGIKAAIIDDKGKIAAIGYEECDIITPRPGWVEQDPEVWWQACGKAVKRAVEKSGVGEQIEGIGFSGQMQGCVLMGKDGKAIGNCLIWLDQRSTPQVKKIEEIMSEEEMLSITGSYCLNSYWAPKLLWLKENRPSDFERADSVLFAKDYLRFRMTGEIAVEVSDGSLSFLLDVPNRKWSDKIIRELEIPENIIPKRLAESQEVVGSLRRSVAEEWGLRPGIQVVAGGGDQPAGGVGMGIVEEGIIGSTIGTSGVIFGCTDQPFVDKQKRAVLSMCHSVPDKWCFLGLALASGGSFKWMRDTLFAEKKAEMAAKGLDVYDYMTGLAKQVAPGSEGLIFLPYFNGDKTPINDENARAVFFGLSYRHDLGAMCRSVMEGVTFSLRDTIEICREKGMQVTEVRAAGGGAKSALWRQMQADIYNASVITTNMEESGCAAGAIMAAVGTGYFKNIKEGCDAFLRIKSITDPIPENVRLYDDYYETYRNLYPALKESYAKQAEIVAGYFK